MARRLKWLLLAGLLLAVAAGVLAFVAVRSGGGAGNEGPLSNLGVASTGFSIPLNVGQSASVSGPFVVKNTGGQPLTLERVRLVGLQHGLTLRGAYVVPYLQHPAGPRPRSATIGIVPGYGLFREDRRLNGATVAPNTQIAIVVGVTPTRAGRYAWSAVDLIYKDGTHPYTLRTPLAARICAPKAPYVGEQSRNCSPPDPLERH